MLKQTIQWLRWKKIRGITLKHNLKNNLKHALKWKLIILGKDLLNRFEKSGGVYTLICEKWLMWDKRADFWILE